MAGGTVTLDGGLATQLADAGHDLSGELWSARLLHDAPEAIVDAHLAFVRAGASVVTTASYQATVDGFARRGHDDAAGLLQRSVVLARRACSRARDEGIERPLWIAASIGPYGAVLADGSEYRGRYGLGVAELSRFHRPRMQILADAGPDVLALETVPDAREAEALLTALDGLGVPAWLSFTIKGERTRAGQPLAEAFGLGAEAADLIAVGINCSAPTDATRAVAMAASASGKPVVVYPNSGEVFSAAARTWTGRATIGDAPIEDWVAAGARLVGGCCRVTPAHVATIAGRLGAPPGA
jgi:S-methylmethionine-dependent homocysteine/selenocysteine methylase